jgi:hypothetical protein
MIRTLLASLLIASAFAADVEMNPQQIEAERNAAQIASNMRIRAQHAAAGLVSPEAAGLPPATREQAAAAQIASNMRVRAQVERQEAERQRQEDREWMQREHERVTGKDIVTWVIIFGL